MVFGSEALPAIEQDILFPIAFLNRREYFSGMRRRFEANEMLFSCIIQFIIPLRFSDEAGARRGGESAKQLTALELSPILLIHSHERSSRLVLGEDAK